MAQHVKGQAANQGQVFRRVVAAGSAGILTELHVQTPVLLIFDAPVAAHGGREPVPLRERAQEIAAFRTGLVTDDPSGFHPPDRLEPGPVRLRVQPVDVA